MAALFFLGFSYMAPLRSAPLHLAAQQGRVAILQAMLQVQLPGFQGFRVNGGACLPPGSMSLHLPALQGDMGILQAMLQVRVEYGCSAVQS